MKEFWRIHHRNDFFKGFYRTSYFLGEERSSEYCGKFHPSPYLDAALVEGAESNGDTFWSSDYHYGFKSKEQLLAWFGVVGGFVSDCERLNMVVSYCEFPADVCFYGDSQAVVKNTFLEDTSDFIYVMMEVEELFK